MSDQDIVGYVTTRSGQEYRLSGWNSTADPVNARDVATRQLMDFVSERKMVPVNSPSNFHRGQGFVFVSEVEFCRWDSAAQRESSARSSALAG